MPMTNDFAVRSYFEARANIRELEQRQFSTIQFFLGAYAAIMGASIGLMQYVGSADRPFLAVAFVFLSNVLSVSLYFSWCAVTLMISRAALFCMDLANSRFHDERDVMWETWLRSKRNTSSIPRLIESTLFVFLLPLVATFFLSLYFGNGAAAHLWIRVLVTVVGIALLLAQYRWVLGRVLATWKTASDGDDGAADASA